MPPLRSSCVLRRRADRLAGLLSSTTTPLSAAEPAPLLRLYPISAYRVASCAVSTPAISSFARNTPISPPVTPPSPSFLFYLCSLSFLHEHRATPLQPPRPLGFASTCPRPFLVLHYRRHCSPGSVYRRRQRSHSSPGLLYCCRPCQCSSACHHLLLWGMRHKHIGLDCCQPFAGGTSAMRACTHATSDWSRRSSCTTFPHCATGSCGCEQGHSAPVCWVRPPPSPPRSRPAPPRQYHFRILRTRNLMFLSSSSMLSVNVISHLLTAPFKCVVALVKVFRSPCAPSETRLMLDPLRNRCRPSFNELAGLPLEGHKAQ